MIVRSQGKPPEEDGPDADGDQGAPDPNDDGYFGFGAAASRALWVPYPPSLRSLGAQLHVGS